MTGGNDAGGDESGGNGVPWFDADELDTWRAVVDGGQRLLGVLNQAMVDDTGLTLQEFRILLLLAERGDTRMSDVAAGVMVPRSTVSRQVARLCAAGLVRQIPDADNGRHRLAQITSAGRVELGRAAKDHARLFRRYVVDALSLRQREIVMSAYRRVDEGLRNRAAGQVP